MRSYSRFQRIWFSLIMVGTSMATTPAHGGWSYFYVTGANGAKLAEVAEQIFATGTPLGYDYEFRVLDLGPNQTPMQGFEVYAGNVGDAPIQTAFTNPTLIPPPGYGTVFGSVGNPTVPILTAESNTFSPVPWDFAEYDQRPNAITGYGVLWTTFAHAVPYGRWTEFDLYSTSGPVTGGGAVGPFAGPGGIGVVFLGGVYSANLTASVPISSSQDTANPFPGFSAYSVPEPGSVVLLASGAVILGCWLRRSSRSIHRAAARTREPARPAAEGACQRG
jgi:hypothetical protein